jgi:hypothetical protein
VLALLRTIESYATQPHGADSPRLELPAEVLTSLRELYEKIEGDIARPFFKIDDFATVDANWSDWIDWFRPVVKHVRERVLPILANPELHRVLMDCLGEGLDEVGEGLQRLSPDLARTFQASVHTGLRSDAAIFANWQRLATTPPDPEAWARREYASIGFGLALLLTLEAGERAPGERARLRFLVLKLKRMAAVSWMTTREILAGIDPPCPSPPAV